MSIALQIIILLLQATPEIIKDVEAIIADLKNKNPQPQAPLEPTIEKDAAQLDARLKAAAGK